MYLGHTIQAAGSLLPLCCRPIATKGWGPSFCLETACHASHPAQPWMPPPPFLLPGQGQPKEFVSNLSSVERGLPGPPALESTPLQLPVATEEGQLRAGTLVALPDCSLVLQHGASVQHWGLVEELVSEGHLQKARKPGQHFPGSCQLHVSVCGFALLRHAFYLITTDKTLSCLVANDQTPTVEGQSYTSTSLTLWYLVSKAVGLEHEYTASFELVDVSEGANFHPSLELLFTTFHKTSEYFTGVLRFRSFVFPFNIPITLCQLFLKRYSNTAIHSHP